MELEDLSYNLSFINSEFKAVHFESNPVVEYNKNIDSWIGEFGVVKRYESLTDSYIVAFDSEELEFPAYLITDNNREVCLE